MRRDAIVVKGIQVYAFGGVTEAERHVGQRYEVDLEMYRDLLRAGISDDLADSASYAEAHRVVVETLRGAEFTLIERAAQSVADALLGQLPIEGVTVEVRKLLPPIDGVVSYAAVRIERDRDEQTV